MILLLIAFSLLLYYVIRSALVNQFDTALASVAHVLAASVEKDPNGIDLEIDIQQMPEFTNNRHPMNYQIWNLDGQVMSRSPLLGTSDLPCFHGSLDKPVYKVFAGPENHPYRAAGTTFLPRTESDGAVQNAEQPLILVVTRDAHELYEQLSLLKWLLFVASCVNAGLALIIGAYVVRSGLRPLNTIAAEIAAIGVDSLKTRIGAQNVPSEVVPIKNRLNELLSRLQTSFDRERQFNADIAHELRTPLAGIRSITEVALTRNRDSNEYQAALSECLQIAKNMESVVNNLLMLTRLEAQQITFNSETVQLFELIDSCRLRFSKKADRRKIIFENQIPVELICHTDPEHLSMVLANLLDNAVEYTDEGGQIRVTGRRIGDSLEIAVSNTGCQLTAEQISKVTDCFWRGDSSRSDAGVHCGLGLALVQRIVKALGGTFSIQLEQGGIFTTKVTLPAESQKTIPA
jgi:two-component system heavy metal sensor histidine kinase CusS